jgi:hypothetical protein
MSLIEHIADSSPITGPSIPTSTSPSFSALGPSNGGDIVWDGVKLHMAYAISESQRVRLLNFS